MLLAAPKYASAIQKNMKHVSGRSADVKEGPYKAIVPVLGCAALKLLGSTETICLLPSERV
jgi:hypothetical protein